MNILPVTGDGSVLRYLVALWMKGVTSEMPVATLLINVTGCFLIGLFARTLSTPTTSPVLRAALTIGFCGGFTTFSTFSADFISMVQDGRDARAIAYAVTSVVIGVLATLSGMLVGSRLLFLRS